MIEWHDLGGIDTTPSPRVVTVSMQPQTAVRRHTLVILLRPAGMPDCPRWLMDGAFVRAQIGTGTMADQLTITPMGNIPLKRISRPGVLCLRLTPLQGCSPARHQQEPVEHDYTDKWLALTLPRWALGQPPRVIRPANPMGLIRGFVLAMPAGGERT